MTTTYGLTSTGLRIRTEEEWREFINLRVWKRLAGTLDLSDRSLEGQIIGILSEALGSVSQLGLAVYASQDPTKAVDAALDALCLLTGTRRRGASKSTVIMTLTGDPTQNIPEGTIGRVPLGGAFETLSDAVIVATDAWVVATLYVAGQRVTTVNGDSGEPAVFVCITGGTSDAVGPGPALIDPGGTPNDPYDIVDGTAHWAFVGLGEGDVDIAGRATETGPTVANALSLTEIVTPQNGLKGINNLNTATVGENQMTNAELRVLRELELAQPGTGPADSIRAAALEIKGVTHAHVFVNPYDTTDPDGMPPHSVEVMVQGGDDQAIYDMLLANVAAGIQTHGTEVGSATDSEGTTHVMKFTRPTEVPIYIAITLVKDPTAYTGDDAVKAAILAYGNAQSTGKNAVSSRIGAAAFGEDDEIGVLEITTCYIKTSPGPTLPTTIAIAPRELATYDAARISVTTSDGVP